MSIEEQWWGSGTSPLNPKGPNGGGSGGDPGDPIGESLRFRGAQYLRGSLPQNHQSVDWTWSCWVKFAKPFQSGNIPQYIMGTAATASAFTYLYRQGNGALASYGPDAIIGHNARSGTIQYPTVKHRDISAWYHVAWYYDSAAKVTKTFINGEFGNEVTGVTTTDTNNNRITIGGRDWDLDSTMFFEGYMAAAYFVDGQALDPTTFGRFNANGVWVPVDPKKDGDTAWYGPNGFHLTFANPGSLGKDYSGNGNDFTATGFDTVSYASGWWVDENANQAVNGEWLNSQGSPYWIDISPANASSSLAFSPGTYSIADAFKGTNIDQSDFNGRAYWHGTDYAPGSGDVKTATFDLRDYPAGTITDVAIWARTLSGGYTFYSAELLDASKTTIPGSTVEINDTTYKWFELPIAGGTPRYLRIFYDHGDNVNVVVMLKGFRVNGQVLSQVAKPASTYDIMQDSPTNNFATLNPLPKNSSGTGTYSDANLTGVDTNATQLNTFSATQTLDRDSSYYWEAYIVNKGGVSGQPYFGVINPLATNNNNADGVAGAFYYTNGLIVWPGSSYYNFSTGPQTSPLPPDFTTGDTLSFYWDGSNNTLAYRVNGANEWKVALSNTQNIDVAPFFGLAHSQKISINYGQQPFRHTPPAGFEPLCTAKMPAAPIANGKDHFQAITGPGSSGGVLWIESTTDPGNVTSPLGTLTSPIYNGSLSGPFIGLAYTFIWDAGGEINGPITLNFVYQAGNHSYAASLDGQTWFGVFSDNGTTITINPGQPFRYVRKYSTVAGNQGYSTSDGIPILGSAQAAFPSGLWWIKDRANTNQHQLVDSVNGLSKVFQSPAGTANNAYTAPTGSSVAWCWNAANKDGGFSIAPSGGAHGLGVKPAMVIDRAGNVWHQSLPAGQGLNITTSAASTSQGWSVNENTVGSQGGPTHYCWAEIPGYSAFGSYTGNANADGPFVYLGFRPAFVLIKSTAAGDWHIYDSTREVYNPETKPLRPNQTVAESAIGSIDFLSNGFKCRIASVINASTTYIYAAFAENPFQSPVTAR